MLFFFVRWEEHGKTKILITTYIRIYSDYLDAWNNSLNHLFEEPIINGYIIIQKNSPVNPIYVEILPGSKSIFLKMTVSKLLTQIGPGIVIQI